MALSNRTLALLASPFEGGAGPTHSVIEMIWTAADAFDYLPEGNSPHHAQPLTIARRTRRTPRAPQRSTAYPTLGLARHP